MEEKLKEWEGWSKNASNFLIGLTIALIVTSNKKEFFSSPLNFLLLFCSVYIILIFYIFSKYKISKIKKEIRQKSKKTVDYIR